MPEVDMNVGNLHVAEVYRRRGVGTWLLRQAADWLRAANVDRLLDYAWLEGTDPGGRVSGTDPDQARMDPYAAQAMTGQ